MNSKNQNIYFCNRPTLAEELIAAGFTPELRKNPWNPARTTWAFDMNHNLCKIVAAYHDSIGKPAPAVITNYLAQGVTDHA